MYFNPAFLSDDPSAVADLSRFEQGGNQPAGTYQVDIFVNQQQYKTRQLVFKIRPANKTPEQPAVNATSAPALLAATVPQDDGTGLTPCLTVSDLDDMGVNTKVFPALAKLPAKQCVDISAAIPGAYTHFDFSQQRLDVSVPQAAMKNSVRGYIPPDRWNQGISAILLNYNFSGSNNRGDSQSDSYFLSLNSGVNLGGWRLRDNSTWNYTRSAGMESQSQWQHVSTYVEHTIAPLKAELVAGDVSTPSDVFDSLPMRGVMIASDDNMLPDSQRGFAPTVRGIAKSNSQVTIKQNGYTIYQTYVPSGPFVISDLYAMSSSGDLQVTVAGSDGSNTTYTVPYAAVPILQREGRMKFAIAAGKYRSGNDSQEDIDFAQVTLIWGLKHGLTAYGGVQTSDNYQAEALGMGLNLGDFGAVSVDATQANSTLTDNSTHSGQSYRAMWAKSLDETGTNLQLATTRFSTHGFYTLDQTTEKIMSGYNTPSIQYPDDLPQDNYTDYYDLYNTQKNLVQATVSQNLGDNGKFGALYVTGTRTTYWNTPESGSSWQVGYSSSINDISYSLNYSYNKSAGEPGVDQQFSLSFSLPLGKWLSPGTRSGGDITQSGGNTAFATYNMNTDNNGQTTNQAGVSGTLLKDNNLSYSVTEGQQNQGGGNNGSASLSYQGTYGNSNIAYNYSPGYQGVNYGLSGGVIIHQHGMTLSQPLGDTNILVAVPGAGDVPVENTTGVTTDSRGYAVVPYASTYRENEVSLDTTSLPPNVDLDDSVEKVVPTQGALVVANFKARVGERVLLTLTHNGKPLPFGATVSAQNSGNAGIVGDDGQVYLAGLSPTGSVSAQWANGKTGQCHATYHLSSPDPKAKQARVVLAQAICE